MFPCDTYSTEGFQTWRNFGEALRKLLMIIQPEIYGSMGNPNKVELNGLLYVLDRLPEGIEECAFIHLTSDEGFEKGSFDPIVPKNDEEIVIV